MSGHSKWANIKRRKEAVDGKRANIYSKIGKEITVAVKQGGPDIAINNRLRDLIAKAKSNNMPGDNINRCIIKASGMDNSVNYEEISYEGFGPCNVAVIVEAMTDNKNRAAADIRHIFSKSGGSMGQTGSVGYMFDKKGVLIIARDESIDEDELMLYLLDNGADDFIQEEEYFEITCAPENFSNIREYLEQNKYKIEEAEVKMVANISQDLTDEETERVQLFLDKLEENDDVQNVWHNANI